MPYAWWDQYDKEHMNILDIALKYLCSLDRLVDIREQYTPKSNGFEAKLYPRSYLAKCGKERKNE